MKQNIKDWWGFRLRVPTDFVHKPITRIELVIFFLIFGIAFQLIWLIVLLYIHQHQYFITTDAFLQSVFEPLKYTLVVPVSIFTFFALIGGLVPMKWVQSTWIGALIVLSRESGNLKNWDKWVLAIGVIGLTLSILRFEFYLIITEMAILTQIVIITVGLTMFQERVSFADRRWQIDIPQWLLQKKDDNGGMIWEEVKKDPSQGGIVQPEDNARPIFEFGYGGKNFPIGISIPENVIDYLRECNMKFSEPDNDEQGKNFCFLYHRYPLSVVLMDKSPVDFPDAKRKIELLCQQILSIAHELRITRFQLATAVLNWVQRDFRYRHDDESTETFPGGPYSEYGRFALETIHDGVGDCECTTLLCVTLLAHLGFETAILHVRITDPASDSHSHHAAVGLEGKGLFLPDEAYYAGHKYIEHEGKKYLYGETATDREKSFGDIPDCWKDYITIQKIDHIAADKGLFLNSGDI